MSNDKKWKVEVVAYSDDSVIHTVECASERQAERVQLGMDVNLNHTDYFTRTVEPQP